MHWCFFALAVKSSNEMRTLSADARRAHDKLSPFVEKLRQAMGGVASGSVAIFIENMRRIFVGGSDTEEVQNNKTVTIGADYQLRIDGDSQMDVKRKMGFNGRSITIAASESINIQVGKSKLSLRKNGHITLAGVKLDILTEEDTSLATKGETRITSQGNHTVTASRIDLN